MKIKSLLLSVFQILVFGFSFAQDGANPELIQNIRKDFYYINSHLDEYEKVEARSGLIAYFKGKKLFKIITANGNEEYYFNGDLTSLYFIFTHYEDKENRYYFHQDKLIRWIDENKNYRNNQDRLDRDRDVLRETYLVFNAAYAAWHDAQKNVFLVNDNKYLLLDKVDPKLVIGTKPKLESESPLVVSYYVSYGKMPDKYQTFITEDVYLYQQNGERIKASISKFIFRIEISTFQPLWTPEENLTTEEKLAKINLEEELPKGYVYAIINTPANFEPFLACFSPNLMLYQTVYNKPPSKEIKNHFFSSDNFQETNNEYLRLKEKYKEHEDYKYENDRDYDPHQNIYFRHFRFPNRPAIHIIGTNGGNPCGGYMDYHLEQILLYENQIKPLFEEGFEYEIDYIFDYDNSGQLRFIYSDYYSHEQVIGIGKSKDNKTMDALTEWRHFIPRCGC